MSSLGNEYTLVEKPAIDYLVGVLGYEYVNSDTLTPLLGERESFRDVILIKRFKAALERLNPWMSEESLSSTIKFLVNSESFGTSLLEINEKIYKAIVDLDFTVPQVIDGQKNLRLSDS